MIVLCGRLVAVGIEKHSDDVLAAQITKAEAELRETGGRIAQIKDRDFKSMEDCVAAYARIEPLLQEYDESLQRYSELYDMAQQRDRSRGFFNVQRLYSRSSPGVWRNTSEVLALVRQINETIKKEASVIRDWGPFRRANKSSSGMRRSCRFWRKNMLSANDW